MEEKEEVINMDDLKEQQRSYWNLKEESLQQSLESSLWNRLQTCCKTDYGMQDQPKQQLCMRSYTKDTFFVYAPINLRRCTSAVNTMVGHDYKNSYLQYGSHDVCNQLGPTLSIFSVKCLSGPKNL